MAAPSPWQVNDGPFLPETHRALWREWASDPAICFAWDPSSRPFEQQVHPAVGSELFAKRSLFLTWSQEPRGLISGFFHPLFQLSTQIEGPASSDCPSSLGEARILVVNPLHPDFPKLAAEIESLGTDYQALDRFHSPLITQYVAPENWAFDLLAWENRPWLYSKAPSAGLWRQKVNELLSLGRIPRAAWKQDVMLGLIRPSLELKEDQLQEVPALAVLDAETPHPERMLSPSQRRYLQSGELRMRVLRHSRKIRFLEIQKAFSARPWRRWVAMGRALVSETYRYVRVKATA